MKLPGVEVEAKNRSKINQKLKFSWEGIIFSIFMDLGPFLRPSWRHVGVQVDPKPETTNQPDLVTLAADGHKKGRRRSRAPGYCPRRGYPKSIVPRTPSPDSVGLVVFRPRISLGTQDPWPRRTRPWGRFRLKQRVTCCGGHKQGFLRRRRGGLPPRPPTFEKWWQVSLGPKGMHALPPRGLIAPITFALGDKNYIITSGGTWEQQMP